MPGAIWPWENDDQAPRISVPRPACHDSRKGRPPNRPHASRHAFDLRGDGSIRSRPIGADPHDKAWVLEDGDQGDAVVPHREHEPAPALAAKRTNLDRLAARSLPTGNGTGLPRGGL